MQVAVVILAAGHGTRMRSKLPKVLHRLAGKPFIRYSVEAAQQVSSLKPVIVIGHAGDLIRDELGDEVDFVEQTPQLGTAHAVMMGKSLLRDKSDLVIVIFADMPLITVQTLENIIEAQQNSDKVFTMVSVVSDNPRGFGRVIRSEDGSVVAIVEEAQATPEQLAVNELNVSAYCFGSDWLWDALDRIQLSPKGEYYLTDLVEIAVKEQKAIGVLSLEDKNEAIGINNRVHLAQAEQVLRQRINEGWMKAGVTMIDPAATYIEAGVQIGQDTIIYPNTTIRGSTVIGQQCEIGPNTIIQDTAIGDRCTILASVLEKAVLENDVEMGPFGRLRKGAHLANGVHMGNFGEVKNSYLGPGTKMGHFSYIGDTKIGPDVNIGAGTITCNYDGVNKHLTEIEEGAFIGSDTMLVAPVKIGKRARTGAGAVVTHDVPPDTTVIGVPARPVKKKESDE